MSLPFSTYQESMRGNRLNNSRTKFATRCALLTPSGRGAVATIAVCGVDAVKSVDRFFCAATSKPLAQRAIGDICYGRWRGALTGEEVVLARCSEHTVEIHCHGGNAASARILANLGQAGCEQVSWKDYAHNANNDPLAVAALEALADARSERTAAILLDQFHGALRREIGMCRELIERNSFTKTAQHIDLLIQRGRLGLHLTQPWRVVIAGAPNVGKSSLLNALAGYDRSIVVDSPGTTRDVVATATVIDGWPVLLADTAGLRTSDDEIEVAGVVLAEQQLAEADLVVLLFDRSQSWSAVDDALVRKWPHAMIVQNKCDLPAAQQVAPAESLEISATTKSGLLALLEAISKRLVPEVPLSGTGVPFTHEQLHSLQVVAAATARNDALLATRELEKLLS